MNSQVKPEPLSSQRTNKKHKKFPWSVARYAFRSTSFRNAGWSGGFRPLKPPISIKNPFLSYNGANIHFSWCQHTLQTAPHRSIFLPIGESPSLFSRLRMQLPSNCGMISSEIADSEVSVSDFNHRFHTTADKEDSYETSSLTRKINPPESNPALA